MNYWEQVALLDSYPHHEMVETTDGEVIELHTCPHCGAVVRGITVELHEEWHCGQVTA